MPDRPAECPRTDCSIVLAPGERCPVCAGVAPDSEAEMIARGLTAPEAGVLSAAGTLRTEREVLDGLAEKGLVAKLEPELAVALGCEYMPTDLGHRVAAALREGWR